MSSSGRAQPPVIAEKPRPTLGTALHLIPEGGAPGTTPGGFAYLFEKPGSQHKKGHAGECSRGLLLPRPARRAQVSAPWQCLYLFPDPQGHGALRLMDKFA